jgi:hypothetical protein
MFYGFPLSDWLAKGSSPDPLSSLGNFLLNIAGLQFGRKLGACGSSLGKEVLTN